MDGIAVGIVKENWSEDFPGRVRVEYTLGEEGKGETKWIPVMTPYAGPGYGSYTLPETGTEVIIGFTHGNPNRPVVLGCLWNKVNTLPAQTAVEKNTVKHFSTKTGWKLILDEEAKTVAMSEPKSKNSFMFKAEEGCLTLNLEKKLMLQINGKDFITLEEGKITITGEVAVKGDKDMSIACKNMTIEPQSDMTIKGSNIQVNPSQNVVLKGTKVEIAPGSQVQISALTTKIEGTSLEIAAKASGKLQSSGMLEVKGSMLKLN